MVKFWLWVLTIITILPSGLPTVIGFVLVKIGWWLSPALCVTLTPEHKVLSWKEFIMFWNDKENWK